LIADAAKYATAGSPSAWCLIRSIAERLLENFVDEAAILWPEKRRRAT
jgi:hypothetical protein